MLGRDEAGRGFESGQTGWKGKTSRKKWYFSGDLSDGIK